MKKVRPVPAGLVIPAPKPKAPHIDNTEMVNAFRAEGGRLVHIQPSGDRRGITVAFKVRSGHIQLATAVQHRGDVFTRKIGTRLAIAHFNGGETISLPLSVRAKRQEAAFLKYHIRSLL